MTDYKAIATWAVSQNVGSSSRCMARHMMGLECGGSYPSDGGDFDRCETLLDAVPAWRRRLSEMASVNRYWEALVLRWEEIRAAPRDRKYKIMKAILNPVEDDDPGYIRVSPGLSMRVGRP